MPEAKIIMLTNYAEDDLLFAAIRGAAGYVLQAGRRTGSDPARSKPSGRTPLPGSGADKASFADSQPRAPRVGGVRATH